MSEIIETHRIEQGQLVICRSQDVEPYLERNKRERNNFEAVREAPMRKVADIPLAVVEQWFKEGVNIFDRNCAKEVQRRLNSSEWAYLRTSPGKCVVK